MLCCLCLPLAAQWLDVATDGVPRSPDGKPILTAPAPKTSDGKIDFSGMWMMANPLPCDGVNRVCGDLAITPQFANIGAGLKIAILYILVSVLFSTVGQLLLKKGMNSMGPVTLSSNQIIFTLWKMATNPSVFIGLAVYLFGTVFWLAALSRVDLSYAYPFASLSYVIMLVASWLMFDEKITLSRVIGTVVIGIGVLLIYRN